MDPSTRFVLFYLPLILLFASLPPNVSPSGGTFTFILLNYTNPNHLLSNGQCCNNNYNQNFKQNSSTSICPLECSPLIPSFRVCLKNYQISIDPSGPCYIGEAESGGGGDSEGSLPIEWDFGFGFRWVGTFSLILEAWQPTPTPPTSNYNNNNIPPLLSTSSSSDPLSPYPSRSLLFRHSSQQWLTISPEFRYRTFTTPTGITVHLKYRVQCLPNYYGDECNKYCKPRDDKFGHYGCSEGGGDVVCKKGWRGEYCMEATCSPPCQHGTCTAPDTCTCALGYSGPTCSNCQPYPGCKHGTCTTPWQCECEEGWGGLFCNQDLNYCTNHRPCKNSGTCFNTGQGSYTCSCLPGFGGVDCGRVGDSSHSPISCYCHGRGKCDADGKCECDEGWRGEECEEEEVSNQWGGIGGAVVRPCDEKKGRRCGGGGTCSSGICICPPGLLPPNCTTPFCTPSPLPPCPISSTCNELKKSCENCPMSKTGRFCNETLLSTTPTISCPCLNGGTCVNNTSTCLCPLTHSGPLCSFPNSTYTLSLLKELSNELSTEHIVLVVIASVATPLLIILSIGVVLVMKRRRERERLREELVVEGQNRENRRKMGGENIGEGDEGGENVVEPINSRTLSLHLNSKEINLWRESQLLANNQNLVNSSISNSSNQRQQQQLLHQQISNSYHTNSYSSSNSNSNLQQSNLQQPQHQLVSNHHHQHQVMTSPIVTPIAAAAAITQSSPLLLNNLNNYNTNSSNLKLITNQQQQQFNQNQQLIQSSSNNSSR